MNENTVTVSDGSTYTFPTYIKTPPMWQGPYVEPTDLPASTEKDPCDKLISYVQRLYSRAYLGDITDAAAALASVLDYAKGLK